MHRVGYEHVGVQGSTAFFEGFAQPVKVGQGVLFTEETGFAVVATLDNAQRHTGQVNARASGHEAQYTRTNRAWPLFLLSIALFCIAVVPFALFTARPWILVASAFS
jgi:hypothetical protein